MSKEAMKLALEALEKGKYYAKTLMMSQEPFDAAIKALAEQPARPYRLLQDSGSKYFGESWDKAEQPAQQALDKMAENARELGLDYEPATYTFKPTSAPVFAFDTKPNYNITFHRDDKQIGVLDFNGPEMTFTGDADESAKLFFDFIARSFKARLEQERAEERRVCEQICIDMYLSADMNTGKAAMAIAARGNT